MWSLTRDGSELCSVLLLGNLLGPHRICPSLPTKLPPYPKGTAKKSKKEQESDPCPYSKPNLVIGFATLRT